MPLLLPMVELTTMTDEGVQLGKEHFACELEMLTGMENVLHGQESLVDYTQLGTMDNERKRLAGTGRDTNYVTVLRPSVLTCIARVRGTTILAVCLPVSWRSLSLPASPSWLSKGDGFALVKPTSLTLVGHQPLQVHLKGSSF